jgi:hypothetical protein
MPLPRFAFRAPPIPATEDHDLNELRFRAAVERAFVSGDDALTQVEKDIRKLEEGGGGGGPYLPLAGGTLTGPLTLPGDPTAALDAAPRQYVDAQVAARSGEQTLNPNGLSQVIFDPIPREATSFVVSLQNVQMNGASVNLLMDFVGDTGNNFGIGRLVSGGAYAAPISLTNSPMEFDSVGTGGIMGNYYFERQLASSIDVWVMTGNHRRGSFIMVHNTGRLILNIPETRPRFRPSGGNTFASNPISVKWRR